MDRESQLINVLFQAEIMDMSQLGLQCILLKC